MDLSKYFELGQKFGLESEKLLTFAREERDKELDRLEANVARDERQKDREEQQRAWEEQQKAREELTKQKELDLKLMTANIYYSSGIL